MDIYGPLVVGYDKSDEGDESALVVMRDNGDKIELLKAEIGEQADILYRLLTEQMTKAEIQFKARDQKFYDNGYEQAKKDIIKVIHEYFEGIMRSTPPTEYIDGEPYHKLGDINEFLTANKELCAAIKSLEAPWGID